MKKIPNFLLCIVLMLIILPIKCDESTTSATSVNNVFSEAELKSFWVENVQNIFVEKLFPGKHNLSVFNDRYQLLSKMVFDRYGRAFDVGLITKYCNESNMVLAGCTLTNGVPRVELFIPALKDIRTSFINQFGLDAGKNEFEQLVIIGFLHELEHLAYDYFSADKVSLDSLVECERKAWAITCEQTMRPLIEKHGVEIGPSHRVYYRNWVIAGRNVDNPQWISFIRDGYKETRKK